MQKHSVVFLKTKIPTYQSMPIEFIDSNACIYNLYEKMI